MAGVTLKMYWLQKWSVEKNFSWWVHCGLLNYQTRNVGVTKLACSLLCDSFPFSVAQNLLSCAPTSAMSHTVDSLPYIHPAAATCSRVGVQCQPVLVCFVFWLAVNGERVWSSGTETVIASRADIVYYVTKRLLTFQTLSRWYFAWVGCLFTKQEALVLPWR